MGYVLLYPILTINIESNNMNATQDASNDMQNEINKKLISFNESQNELIFKTRARLFEAEKMQRLSFCLIGLLTLGILLLAVNDILIKGVINGQW